MRLSSQYRIPVAKPYITGEDIKEVIEALRKRCLSQGEYVQKFEEEFAEFVGTKYAVAFNSATAALHTCLSAIGVRAGDEVITSPFTFAATANVIVLLGAKPVFVDIELETYNIDPRKIEDAITNRTKAIIPVHYAGQCADMDPILEIAEAHDIFVLEDAAEAVGALYKGRKAGSLGNAAAFSFYPNKNLATGEGGMLTTNDSELAEKCRILREHGQDSRYHHVEIGWNYKMPDYVAALGRVQLRHLNYVIRRKQELAEYYNRKLSDIIDIITPIVRPYCTHTYMLYTIRTKTHEQREKIRKTLEREGIETRIAFPPVHLQPAYVRLFGFKLGDYPLSELAYHTTLCLPIYVEMTRSEQELVVEIIKSVMC